MAVKTALALCRLGDIPEQGLCVTVPLDGVAREVVLFRQGDNVRAFANVCPHIFINLDLASGLFLTRDGRRIYCSQHGAEFEMDSGLCTAGPCRGRRLYALPVVCRGENVMLGAVDTGTVTWPTCIVRRF